MLKAWVHTTAAFDDHDLDVPMVALLHGLSRVQVYMFIVRTYLGPSPIHGNGVFAGEDLTAGQRIWQFAPSLDLVVPFDVIAGAPQAFRDYMNMYAYVSPQVQGGMVLSCDHAKFLNHSDDPNTVIQGPTTLARVAIRKDEEITCDYRICVADWNGQF